MEEIFFFDISINKTHSRGNFNKPTKTIKISFNEYYISDKGNVSTNTIEISLQSISLCFYS